ncbi:hypothetical protein [Amycolatopsis sp. lyj-346]|uniref:hypothetical protein n=1 Tax=Amycolatopsis sp. lyj-346 TaxID=2789289 RepID=UPI00397923B2
MSAPHVAGGHEITVRRGQFWVPGERVRTEHGTVQRAPLFVQWEAPPGDTAIEPMGPAFARFPGLGTLTWGLTSAAITCDPPARDPAEVTGRRIPAPAGKPVAVVTGGASAFAGFAPQVVEFLAGAGAHARPLHLPDFGITGNGHGLIFEANSDETVKPVIDWILATLSTRGRTS